MSLNVTPDVPSGAVCSRSPRKIASLSLSVLAFDARVTDALPVSNATPPIAFCAACGFVRAGCCWRDAEACAGSGHVSQSLGGVLGLLQRSTPERRPTGFVASTTDLNSSNFKFHEQTIPQVLHGMSCVRIDRVVNGRGDYESILWKHSIVADLRCDGRQD